MFVKCPSCGYERVQSADTHCPVCENPLRQVTSTQSASGGVIAQEASLLLNTGQLHMLSQSLQTTIGRGSCTIRLADPSVPGLAAVVLPQKVGGFVLRNVSGSVTLNGQSVIIDYPLADGDRIQIGGVILVYTVSASLPKTSGGQQAAGGQIVPRSSGLPAKNAPQGPVMPPVQPPYHPPSPPPRPQFQLHNWGKNVPSVEGSVSSVDGPHSMEDQPSILKRFVAAAILGQISSWMAHLPLSYHNQLHIWNCRLEDFASGMLCNVIIVNKEPRALLQLGDIVAVWGKKEEGNILLLKAYVYDTNSWITVKT